MMDNSEQPGYDEGHVCNSSVQFRGPCDNQDHEIVDNSDHTEVLWNDLGL